MFGHRLDSMISSNRSESVTFVTTNARWPFGDRSPRPCRAPATPGCGPARRVTSPQVLPASPSRGGVISTALGGRGEGRACARRRLRDTRSRAYVRARRSREAGGCARAVAGSPLGLLRTGSRALAAAAIMSAAIEQEFQEIDATNDWQARYLVS